MQCNASEIYFIHIHTSFVIKSNSLHSHAGLIDDKHYENSQFARRELEDDCDDTIDNAENERVMMKDSIQIVTNENIEEIYRDVSKCFLFHQMCVTNVLFNTKWEKRLLQKCFKCVDVSDDAFAFLTLENNSLRYVDIADQEKDSKDHSLPIYVDAISRRRQDECINLKGNGWSREGMIRFQKLQMRKEDLFDNEADMMETLG